MTKSRTREYKRWGQMIYRCTNPNSADFSRYGGAGIIVSEAWRNSFDAFLSDLGPMPSPKHTLERIDNSKGYEKGNVRWATRAEQARNRSNTKLSLHKLLAVHNLSDEGLSQREIGNILQIHQSTVGRVLSGKRWSGVLYPNP